MTQDARSAAQTRCEAEIWNPGYWSKRQCSRIARVEAESLKVCHQHARLIEKYGVRKFMRMGDA